MRVLVDGDRGYLGAVAGEVLMERAHDAGRLEPAQLRIADSIR